MSPSTNNQIQCADCGTAITEAPIRISRTEHLCQACWPFLLKPLVDTDDRTAPSGNATGTFGPSPLV